MEKLISQEQKTEKMSPLRFGLMLVALGLGYWLVMLLRQSLVIISQEVTADLGLDSAGLGVLGAVMLYGYAAMQIPGGILSDKLGARRIISLSLLLTAVATLFFGKAENLMQAVIARALTGVGVAVVYVPALSAIREGCTDENFPFMTSLLFLFGNLGSICAKKPMALLADSIGWRQMHMIIAAAALVIAVVIWFVVPERPKKPRELPEKQMLPPTLEKKSSWSVLRSGAFLSLMVWMFVVSGTISGSESLWDMTYLTQVQGLVRDQAVSILTWAAIVAMVTGPLVGAFAKKRGALAFAGTSYLRAAMFVALALLPLGASFGSNAVCFMIKGVSMGCYPLAFAQLRRIIPAKISGTILGIANTVGFIGGALFTQGIGLAVNGADPAAVFNKVFLLFAGMVALVTAFAYYTNYKAPASCASSKEA